MYQTSTVCTLYSLCTAICIHYTGTFLVAEFASLKIVSAYSDGERYKRDASDVFPEHISCELSVSGETVGLNLLRNRNVDGKKPVYVMRNGKIVLETISTLKVRLHFIHI